MNRIDSIRARIEQALHPTQLHIEDDSAKHVGHLGAANGAGHFRVKIVADIFNGRPLVARHKMVYDAVADMLGKDIHALSIRAHTIKEEGPG